MKFQSSSIRCSKVISNVKVSERRIELQNDRMTELQTGQKQYAPDFLSRGHKNVGIVEGSGDRYSEDEFN